MSVRSIDQDERERLLREYRVARAATHAGHHGEALRLLLASHQDPHQVPPVRDSFVIGALADLAELHPPARAAVLELRERLASELLAAAANYDRLHAVLAIDEHFGLAERSYALALELDRLHGPQPCTSSDLMRVYHAAGDTARARAHLGDARTAIANLVDAANRIARDSTHRGRHDVLSRAGWYLRSVNLVLEIVRAGGETSLAADLQRAAREDLADGSLRAILAHESLQPGYIESELSAELEKLSPNDSDSTQ